MIDMRWLRWLGLALALVLVAVQLVPYGRDHTNPAGRLEPRWDRAETRALAVRACYDCHSNETAWPWYTHVAPLSWLAQKDVDEGRRKLNFSEWGRPQKEAREAARTIRKREMPPWLYLPLHPDARLSAEETQVLVAGLEATLGSKDRRRAD